MELGHLLEDLLRRLRRSGFQGYTLTLKVKYADFTQITRSITAPQLLSSESEFFPLIDQLLSLVDCDEEHPVRLLGLAVSNPPEEKAGVAEPKWIQLEFDWELHKE